MNTFDTGQQIVFTYNGEQINGYIYATYDDYCTIGFWDKLSGNEKIKFNVPYEDISIKICPINNKPCPMLKSKVNYCKHCHTHPYNLSCKTNLM